MELQTLTADEMLDGAVARMFKIAEEIIRRRPRLVCIEGQKYRYSFDSTMIFTYIGKKSRQNYPDGYAHTFEREDGAFLYATKYSQSPELIE